MIAITANYYVILHKLLNPLLLYPYIFQLTYYITFMIVTFYKCNDYKNNYVNFMS